MHTKHEINMALENLTQFYEFENLVESSSEEEKKVIFSEFIASDQIVDKLIKSIVDFQILIELFPEEKDLLFTKFIASDQKSDKFTTEALDFDVLFGLFPEKEETLFNMLKKKFPNSTILSPTLRVPEQLEPNCGLNALSSITKFISEKENNPSSYFPIKSEDSNKSLKKLRKLVGVEGPGAIFSFKKYQSLVNETGLFPTVLYVDKEEQFSDTIKNLINLNIPVIIPYDIRNETGTWAHYGVITGFIESGDQLTFIVSHNNKRDFFNKDDLFLNTSSLKEFAGTKFVKKAKSGFYEEVSSELETGYKEHIYQRTNLENTLRNRLLIVCSESMKKELEASIIYKDIEKIIETNPQVETELGEPNWDILYPKESSVEAAEESLPFNETPKSEEVYKNVQYGKFFSGSKLESTKDNEIEKLVENEVKSESSSFKR